MTSPTRRPAAALILVLWAIAVLALLAGGVSFTLRQDLAIANIERDRLVSHCLARAGVERAIASLMDDTGSTDTLTDYWADDEPVFKEIELTGGTFSVLYGDDAVTPQTRYGATDESAKLNANVATYTQLMDLPNMTGSIAAAIIDWRDNNEEPELEGVEGAYYAGQSHPYEIRNGPLRTLRELLLVRGVTPELLYGEDLNTNGLLDPGENDGDLSAPPDNADGRLDRGWFAYLTVYSYECNTDGTGQQRLNLKTADAGTLSGRLMLESWAAESIVKAREQRQFEHLADLLNVTRDQSIQRGPVDADFYTRSDSEKDRPVTETIFEQIVDRLTLSDDQTLPGRININTAPQAVLATLPEVDEDLAAAIVRQRDAASGFSSIGQLLKVSGMNRDKFAELESSVTVRSNVFRILSYGHAVSGLATATIECVVERRQDEPRVLYWLESTP